MHDMLIAYVNGTLDPAGKSSFETHLSTCPACRTEMPLLEKLQAEVESLGEEVLSGHPAAAELVDAVLPEVAGEVMPEDRRAEVLRHLSFCPTCAEESRWVLGTETAASPALPQHLARPGVAWPALAWRWAPAAAAVLAVAVALPFLLRQPEPLSTGVGRIALVEATQRAGPLPEVAVAATAEAVQLLFRVDLGPEELPATFELAAAGGVVVHRAPTVAATDLYQGQFLLFTCNRTDCPDGDYTGRLLPAGDTGIPVEYPFRLGTAAP